MPVSGGKYVAPAWKDNAPPALDAAELQAMTDAIERTEASIGDVTTPAQKMGLTGELSIGKALGVLADVGNVHVWKRATITADSRPAGYTLGPIKSGYIQSSTGSASDYRPVGSYGSTINIESNGNSTIASPNSAVYAYSTSGASKAQTELRGNFLKSDSDPPGGVTVPQKTLYFPADATFSYITNGKTLGYPANYCIVVDKMQEVEIFPETPPGTHIDFLTSTNPNAYQEGTVGNTTIEYLGSLGDKVRIEKGSYVGTGTYRETNASSITCSGKIAFLKMVCMIKGNNEVAGIGNYQNTEVSTIPITDTYIQTQACWFPSSGRPSYYKMSTNRKTFYWYSTYGAEDQFNLNGYTYHYIAFLD